MAGLWVDKYRPVQFERLTFHQQANERLKSLAISEDVPHLLLSGPRGAGKMTRIRLFLRELFDASIFKLKIDEKAFQTPSGRKIEITVFTSNYHIELNPSDVGIYDRVVVQETIKELAQTQQIDKTRHAFKVAVILEADRLSKDAQHALRRTMEKYSSNLRLIFCCTSSSRIIAPIRSRCLVMRVPAPSTSDILKSLNEVAQYEGVRIPDQLAKSICETCGGNNRRALLSLEASIAKNTVSAEKPDWEDHIEKIAQQALREQSPASLLIIRSKLYDLLTHAIPANIIIKAIMFDLLSRTIDTLVARKIIDAAAFYEYRLVKGSKAILHLEAFMAKAMSIITAPLGTAQ